MIVYIVGFDTNTSFLIVWLFYLLYIRAFFPIFLLGLFCPFSLPCVIIKDTITDNTQRGGPYDEAKTDYDRRYSFRGQTHAAGSECGFDLQRL